LPLAFIFRAFGALFRLSRQSPVQGHSAKAIARFPWLSITVFWNPTGDAFYYKCSQASSVERE